MKSLQKKKDIGCKHITKHDKAFGKIIANADIGPNKMLIPKMDKDVARVFLYSKEVLTKMGCLSSMDMVALQLYAEVYIDYVREYEQLQSEGHIIEPEDGAGYLNPRSRVVRDLRASLLDLSKNLGFSPVHRDKLLPLDGKTEKKIGESLI